MLGGNDFYNFPQNHRITTTPTVRIRNQDHRTLGNVILCFDQNQVEVILSLC